MNVEEKIKTIQKEQTKNFDASWKKFVKSELKK